MITVKAYAKLNLTLDITGLREDGYHLLESVMQSVSLCDIVCLSENASGEITVKTSNPAIADDKSNIAYRAAEAFFRETGISNPGITIGIEKNIPVGAGMAGGSADGAAVIVALSELFEAKLPTEELCRIGSHVGADVPFCIVGGTMFAKGIGEQLSPLPALPPCYIAIAKPSVSVSTAEAYRAVDSYEGAFHCPGEAELTAIYQEGDLSAIARNICNIFEPAISLPDALAIRDTMLSLGALGARMTGSGSAVFGIFSQKEAAETCCAKLKEQFDNVYLTTPTSVGCEII